MGWEMWVYPDFDSSCYSRVGFFCNTADVSFGPVCYIYYGINSMVEIGVFMRQFYEAWEELIGWDPRGKDDDYIRDAVRVIEKHKGWVHPDDEDDEDD